jgi:hypothetical protein
VGDGSSIFLWLDWWHPSGILVDKFGFRVVYDAGSILEAKVASVMNELGGIGVLLVLMLLCIFKVSCLV